MLNTKGARMEMPLALPRRKAGRCAAWAFMALVIAAAAAHAQEWRRIGPEVGNVASLAAAPSKPEVVYAGLCPGGVFRSADRALLDLRRLWSAAEHLRNVTRRGARGCERRVREH